jgi:hypothetical protein
LGIPFLPGGLESSFHRIELSLQRSGMLGTVAAAERLFASSSAPVVQDKRRSVEPEVLERLAGIRHVGGWLFPGLSG